MSHLTGSGTCKKYGPLPVCFACQEETFIRVATCANPFCEYWAMPFRRTGIRRPRNNRKPWNNQGATHGGDNRGATEQDDGDNQRAAHDDGDTQGASEQNDGDNQGATHDGDNRGATEHNVGDNQGAARDGDNQGATEEYDGDNHYTTEKTAGYNPATTEQAHSTSRSSLLPSSALLPAMPNTTDPEAAPMYILVNFDDREHKNSAEAKIAYKLQERAT